MADKNWIQAMIEREAIPKAARQDTIAEFCAKWEISDSTYNYQKNLKENKKRILEVWLNEASDGGNEVLAKLKEKALSGSEKSIEMYLKFVLQLKEGLDLTTDGDKLGKGIDDKEFEALMTSYARRKEGSSTEEVI